MIMSTIYFLIGYLTFAGTGLNFMQIFVLWCPDFRVSTRPAEGLNYIVTN
jgi:hypothetical protein